MYENTQTQGVAQHRVAPDGFASLRSARQQLMRGVGPLLYIIRWFAILPLSTKI